MTQHRVRIYETGAPGVLRYETSPTVGAAERGQVLLRQDAIGLNFLDTMFRSGAISVPLPFDMGVEAAGVVEAVGPAVEHLKVGDRAAYFFSFGAYTDVRLIGAEALVKLPEGVSTLVAAALMAKGLTAWMLLRRVHAVRPGEFVLVHGAAGGVGSLLSSWAKALGASVIATVGSQEKAASVRDRGIKHVLRSDEPDLGAKIRGIAGGRGVDVVYELVGRETFKQSITALGDRGDLVHLGNASGAPEPGDRALLAGRSIRYVEPSTGQFVKDRQSLEEASADLFAAYKSGALGHVSPTTYPLADVARAHQDIADRRIIGSAILIP